VDAAASGGEAVDTHADHVGCHAGGQHADVVAAEDGRPPRVASRSASRAVIAAAPAGHALKQHRVTRFVEHVRAVRSG